jgi:hypothetical protein
MPATFSTSTLENVPRLPPLDVIPFAPPAAPSIVTAVIRFESARVITSAAFPLNSTGSSWPKSCWLFCSVKEPPKPVWVSMGPALLRRSKASPGWVGPPGAVAWATVRGSVMVPIPSVRSPST